MARIYTRTGDDGTTGLIGGRRVSKDSLRIEAYGTVDELNAVLGLVRSHPLPEAVDQIVQRVQDDLFTVGGRLAMAEGFDGKDWGIPDITAVDIARLEGEIDAVESRLEPLTEFVLPGGCPPAALLHLARTVARRAERRCVAFADAEAIAPEILQYLNRLSDLLFVLARLVNREASHTESHPSFGRRQP